MHPLSVAGIGNDNKHSISHKAPLLNPFSFFGQHKKTAAASPSYRESEKIQKFPLHFFGNGV